MGWDVPGGTRHLRRTGRDEEKGAAELQACGQQQEEKEEGGRRPSWVLHRGDMGRRRHGRFEKGGWVVGWEIGGAASCWCEGQAARPLCPSFLYALCMGEEGWVGERGRKIKYYTTRFRRHRQISEGGRKGRKAAEE